MEEGKISMRHADDVRDSSADFQTRWEEVRYSMKCSEYSRRQQAVRLVMSGQVGAISLHANKAIQWRTMSSRSGKG